MFKYELQMVLHDMQAPSEMDSCSTKVCLRDTLRTGIKDNSPYKQIGSIFLLIDVEHLVHFA